MKRRRQNRKRTSNDIAMAYRIDSLGYGRKRVSKQFFFKTLLAFLDGKIVKLPRGWEIIWRWQNSKKQNWREDEFTEVVANSRASFMTLMRRRLKRDFDNLSPIKRVSKRKGVKGKRRRKKKRTGHVSKMRKAKTRRRKSRRVC